MRKWGIVGFVIALLLLVVVAARADADPTWTDYNRETCTITVTPSGRTVFQVTRDGVAEVFNLSDHNPITLDVDGVSWSVAVERSGQGWVTVITGEALSCTPTPTTTTTEPPTTTTEPPTVTTTSFLRACDDVECPKHRGEDEDVPEGFYRDSNGHVWPIEESG